MRDKEGLHDYRFMAEPNLPPLHLYLDSTVPSRTVGAWARAGGARDLVVNVDELKRTLPELPVDTRRRMNVEHGLSEEQCNVLMVPWDSTKHYKHEVTPKSLGAISSSSIFNVNIITPTSRGDIMRQIVSSVYIT